MFNDVVQGDVGIKSGGSRERRHGEPGKGGERIFGRPETRKDQVEPHHIGLQPANRVQQPHGIGEAAEFPAANHIEARQFRLLLGLQGIAVRIRSEFIVREFVGQDGQLDVRMPLDFAGNMEAVFVQLAVRWEETPQLSRSSSGPALK